MSHVAEGRLHAYLDGELDVAGRGDIEAHLADCRACRAALEAARTVRDESRFILRGADPAEIPEPPFGLLQHRADVERRAGSARQRRLRAAAWAASLIAALGLGWYGREALTRSSPRAADTAVQRPATTADATGPAAPAAGAARPAEGAERADRGAAEPAAAASVATAEPARAPADRAAAKSTEARGNAGTATVAEDRVAAAADRAAGSTAGEAAVAESSALPAPAARMAKSTPGAVADGMVATVQPAADGAVAWNPIDLAAAKRLLGTQPYLVPGLEVVGVETTALDDAGSAVVRVRQRLESGDVLELYQRREEGPTSSRARREEPPRGGGVVRPPETPTPRPPRVPPPTPSGKPEPAAPARGDGVVSSLMGLVHGQDAKEGKALSDIPWLVRLTPGGDATMLAGSVRITAHGPVQPQRLRALLEQVKPGGN